MAVRPKTYDRPGYREQSPKRREIERLAIGEVRGDYRNCKGCGDVYPVSVLNFMGECLDCEHFSPLDHEDDER